MQLTLGQGAPHFSADHVRFFNLMLEMDRIRYTIDPIIDSVSSNIEFAYKSPAKIDFISAIPSKNPLLAHCVQLNEICVRLFHLDSGQDFFLIMESRLARTFLSRLLANSLVDDSPHLLFSSTEKGIFNFILARLLGEMKKSLQERMPNLKILGIFHAVDHVIKDFTVANHGACNFVVNFAADQYHVVLFCPTQMLELGFTRAINKDNLLARGGHIKHNLSFVLHRLHMPVTALNILSFGDLILFDHSSLSYKKNYLTGRLQAMWSDFFINGNLEVKDNYYNFVTTSNLTTNVAGTPMDTIEVTGAETTLDQSQLASLARNLRVQVNVELSRLPMSLQELCDLKPGEIVNLHRKLDDPLELVVDGKIIGFCTPVQIDGRLGVKILSIEGTAHNVSEIHDEN
jgi:flagellar motor switch/type III secretory pathway protein FliN